MPKQVQRDPIKGFIEHVDLLVVKKGEKVTVDVPVILVGTPAPDTLVVTEHAFVSLEAEATHIPESVELSIQGARAGTQFHTGDLVLPAGSTLQGDADLMLVNVTGAPSAEEIEEELAEAEAEAGIEKDVAESETSGEGESGDDAQGADKTEGA